MKAHPITRELIAPCGMNCALCSKYLAYLNGLKRSQCTGCRPRDKKCEYLFQKCAGNNTNTTVTAPFCFECPHYPCKQINRMDNRYRNNYATSVKENLECIKEKGVLTFLEEQYEKHNCVKCGGLISVHNRKCFKCDTITKLIEKLNT